MDKARFVPNRELFKGHKRPYPSPKPEFRPKYLFSTGTTLDFILVKPRILEKFQDKGIRNLVESPEPLQVVNPPPPGVQLVITEETEPVEEGIRVPVPDYNIEVTVRLAEWRANLDAQYNVRMDTVFQYHIDGEITLAVRDEQVRKLEDERLRDLGKDFGLIEQHET
jgi:hypothetical protein